MIKEPVKDRAKWTWKRRGAYRVLELIKQGKTLPEIAEEVNWRQETVWKFVSSPSFLERLNRYLSMRFFHYQSRKIQILDEAIGLLRKRAVETIDELPPAVASRNLMTLLKMKSEPTLKLNITNSVPGATKSEPGNEKDLREYFNLPELDKTP